jgi:hypothetical protein
MHETYSSTTSSHLPPTDNRSMKPDDFVDAKEARKHQLHPKKCFFGVPVGQVFRYIIFA